LLYPNLEIKKFAKEAWTVPAMRVGIA